MPDKDKDKDKDRADNLNQNDKSNEEESDKDKNKAKKSLISSRLAKFLIYSFLCLFLIFLVILISILVVKYETSNFDLNYNQVDLNKSISEPKDIYEIPEFKLALDKSPKDSMTTIVQIKLFIAYKQGDQSVLNEIIQRKEQIKDRIQFIISSKTYDQISTARFREDFLKEDLLYGLNSILSEEILDIYFDTFVISRIQGN